MPANSNQEGQRYDPDGTVSSKSSGSTCDSSFSKKTAACDSETTSKAGRTLDQRWLSRSRLGKRRLGKRGLFPAVSLVLELCRLY